MAYMNQEQKAKIKIELKKVVPSNWKWSLAVDNHSTIVFTVTQGQKELLPEKARDGFYRIHPVYLKSIYTGELLETWVKILKALNLDNYDHSDIMTDYFDVGHYVSIKIGKYEKPFIAK